MLKILWSFSRNAGQGICKEAAQHRARVRVIKPGDGVGDLSDPAHHLQGIELVAGSTHESCHESCEGALGLGGA